TGAPQAPADASVDVTQQIGRNAVRAEVGRTGAVPQFGLPPPVRVAAADEPPLAPPPRRAPLFLECSSSLSQTVPPSTSLLPDGSLAPVLSEEMSCDVPCWRSS